MPSREQFAGDHQIKKIGISFSESVASPHLVVTARPFFCRKIQGTEHGWQFGIAPDELPPEHVIRQWAENQMLSGTRTSFEAHMDKLLLLFIRRGETPVVERPANTANVSFYGLLSDLYKLKCMWEIWSHNQFFRHDWWQGVRQVTPLHPQYAPVQDSLRLYAAQTISELERKIIEAIEKHFIKDPVREEPGVRLRNDIARWLLFWQMILIYRQSLLLLQQQADAAIASE